MLDLGTRYQIASLQSQLLEWNLLQSQGLFERQEDWRDAAVARDATGRFASKGASTSSKESSWASFEKSTSKNLSNLFGLPQSPTQKQPAQKLFDDIKDGIDRLKAVKLPAEAQGIANQIVANAIPAATYLARTVAPDILIGLTLGESLPVILGGAAVFAAVALATDKALEELDITNPWVKAGANIAVSLIVSDVVRGVNGVRAWKKFANAGVFPIVNAGKTAQDLKATFKAVQKQMDEAVKPAKSLLEQQRRDRFLHSLTLAAQTNVEKPIGRFLADTADYASGFVRTQDENLARYVEKELSGLKPALKEAEVDVEALTARLAQMCDMSDIPLLLRSKRAGDVKSLVQRAKEMPKAIEDAAGPEVAKIEKTLKDLSKEFETRLSGGTESLDEILEDPKWMESMLLVDKGNAIDKGVEWRSMLLNAEVKHGKQLDAFVYGKKNLRDRYEAFIGSLVKDNPKKAKISLASDEQFLKAKPTNMLPAEEAMWEPWASKEIRDMVAQQCKKGVELFAKISPIDLNVSIGSFGYRAFHTFEGNLINVATGDVTVVWHELCHHLEDSVPNIWGLASAFRGARTLKDGFDDMARLGMPGEQAVFDTFVHPYSGKVYLADATEVVSTGIEGLASGFGLHKLATLDREHLMFALSVLSHE